MSTRKLHPNKLLILDDKIEEKTTATGIIIPGTTKSPNQQGTVVVVGKGVGEVGMPYVEGDRVLYNPNAGIRVRIDDIDYRLLDIQEIYIAL